MTLLVRHAPTPALRDHVQDYCGFEEHSCRPTRRREGPGSGIVLILSFGNEWRIGSALEPERPLEALTSFVGGLRDSSVLTEHDGWSAGMQVDLNPTTAHMLFGLPMHDLAEHNVPLDALLCGAGLLVERLQDARSWAERFSILDQELAARLVDSRPPTPGVDWAWHRLRESRGRVAVGTLSDELGWSRKRLVARFREEVGLPPKAVARLFRFEHALELVDREADASWAKVAFTAGYYDQSHLINEFRAITGVTPPDYAADRTEAA